MSHEHGSKVSLARRLAVTSAIFGIAAGVSLGVGVFLDHKREGIKDRAAAVGQLPYNPGPDNDIDKLPSTHGGSGTANAPKRPPTDAAALEHQVDVNQAEQAKLDHEGHVTGIGEAFAVNAGLRGLYIAGGLAVGSLVAAARRRHDG